MEVLIVVLTLLTLSAQLLDRADTSYVSQRRMRNVHAIYVLFFHKLLTLYYVLPLSLNPFFSSVWGDELWEACSNAM